MLFCLIPKFCFYNIFRFSVDWNKGLEIVDLFVLRPWGFAFFFLIVEKRWESIGN